MELVDSLTPWFWLILGLCLLAVEVLGTAGYMLWLGLSALLVGLALFLLPLTGLWQILLFVALSLISTYFWWRYQHQKDHQNEQEGDLNRPSKSLIGQRAFLSEDLINHQGRLQIGNSNWTIKAPENYAKGTEVIITDMQGIILLVKKI